MPCFSRTSRKAKQKSISAPKHLQCAVSDTINWLQHHHTWKHYNCAIWLNILVTWGKTWHLPSFLCSLKQNILLSKKKVDSGQEYAAVLSSMFWVSSNYFKPFLHSCGVADFVSLNVPGDLYCRFTKHLQAPGLFSSGVALESGVKS